MEEHIYFMKTTREIFFTSEGIDIPQQFLRRYVTTKIGKRYLYNWKYYPGWRKLILSYKKLRPFFEKYENKKIR